MNLSQVGGVVSSSAVKLDPKDLMHCEDLGRSNYTIQHSTGHKGTLHWVGKLLAADKMQTNSDGLEMSDMGGTPGLQKQMLEQKSISSEIPRTESSPYIGRSHESPQREHKGSMGNVLEYGTEERQKKPTMVRMMTVES